MTNGDQELADHIADDMDDFIWRVREDFALGTYPRPEEGGADRGGGDRGRRDAGKRSATTATAPAMRRTS